MATGFFFPNKAANTQSPIGSLSVHVPRLVVCVVPDSKTNGHQAIPQGVLPGVAAFSPFFFLFNAA